MGIENPTFLFRTSVPAVLRADIFSLFIRISGVPACLLSWFQVFSYNLATFVVMSLTGLLNKNNNSNILVPEEASTEINVDIVGK